MLATGYSPAEWRVVLIILISKLKGTHEADVNNQRPTNLLQVYSKIFERIWGSRISRVFRVQNPLHTTQELAGSNPHVWNSISVFLACLEDSQLNDSPLISVMIDWAGAFEYVDREALGRRSEHMDFQHDSSTSICKNMSINTTKKIRPEQEWKSREGSATGSISDVE
jgi:hypothetical protein